MNPLPTLRETLEPIHGAVRERDENAVRLALADSAAAVANGAIDASHAALVYQAGRDAYKSTREANRKSQPAKAPHPVRAQDPLPADCFTTVSAPDWATQLLTAGTTPKTRTRKAGK